MWLWLMYVRGTARGEDMLLHSGQSLATERACARALEVAKTAMQKQHTHALIRGVCLETFETAGCRAETWPAAVRAAALREAEAWIARNPERVIRLVSTGATAGAVYLALHHAKKT